MSQTTRRLAAIMFTDTADHTVVAHKDESLSLIEELRSIRPK